MIGHWNLWFMTHGTTQSQHSHIYENIPLTIKTCSAWEQFSTKQPGWLPVSRDDSIWPFKVFFYCDRSSGFFSRKWEKRLNSPSVSPPLMTSAEELKSKFIWKQYGVVQSSEYKGRSQGWALLPALTLTCCVASDKPLRASVLPFPLPLKQKYYHSLQTFFWGLLD